MQICSNEFLSVVRAASDSTVLFEVQWSRRPALRFRRKLHLGSYLGYDVDAYAEDLERALQDNAITHVFLNKAELLRFARLVRRLSGSVKVVVMSHGNQSGDDLYEVAGPDGRHRGFRSFGSTWRLGLDLRTESYFRHRFVDAVCVMSEEEAALERWLGANEVFYIPRIVSFDLLDWDPVPGRVGYVGTLDHTPNRIALERLLPLLDESSEELEIEMAGKPTAIGRDFESRFRRVSYLGPMGDTELVGIASRWMMFLNPILWLSRGASMKLGRALGWGLPVVSTASGARGYSIPEDCLFLCRDSERAFAEVVLRLNRDVDSCRAVREALMRSASDFPTAKTVGDELRQRLA